MIDQESITRLNIQLETIATINSFTNHDKTYYIALLDKIDNDITPTLRQHFEVKTWTFLVDCGEKYSLSTLGRVIEGGAEYLDFLAFKANKCGPEAGKKHEQRN